MKKVLACAAIIILTAFKGGDGNSISQKQPCNTKLDGVGFECKTKLDKQNGSFYFMFYCEGDSMRAIIMGPVTNGKYFRANVNNLELKGDSIAFNFIEGEFYRIPFTLNNYRNYGGPLAVGFSADRIYYKGTMKGDSIIDLKCQDRYYTCATDTLLFRKK